MLLLWLLFAVVVAVVAVNVAVVVAFVALAVVAVVVFVVAAAAAVVVAVVVLPLVAAAAVQIFDKWQRRKFVPVVRSLSLQNYFRAIWWKLRSIYVM